MNKREIAKRMKSDQDVISGNTWINRQVAKKKSGKGSLEIANPKIGKNMRGGKMILEGNEHNRP